jgi:hypothetical protein
MVSHIVGRPADDSDTGQRTNFGDPAFTKNVSTLEKEFLLPSTAADVRAKIDEVTHPAIYYDANNCAVFLLFTRRVFSDGSRQTSC